MVNVILQVLACLILY